MQAMFREQLGASSVHDTEKVLDAATGQAKGASHRGSALQQPRCDSEWQTAAVMGRTDGLYRALSIFPTREEKKPHTHPERGTEQATNEVNSPGRFLPSAKLVCCLHREA